MGHLLKLLSEVVPSLVVHSVLILLSIDFAKEEIFDVPHLIEMFLPDVGPQLFAGEYGGGAYGIKVDEDQLPNC
mgnify:CR=1 FL=1